MTLEELLAERTKDMDREFAQIRAESEAHHVVRMKKIGDDHRNEMRHLRNVGLGMAIVFAGALALSWWHLEVLGARCRERGGQWSYVGSAARVCLSSEGRMMSVDP